MLEAYKLAFMAHVIPAAIKACTANNVPYQICCAQAALESGYGKKAAHYNFWGIKGSGDAGSQNWVSKEWKHGKYVIKTQQFAKFSSAEVAFDAYAKLVSSGEFFKGSTAFANDPAAFVAYLWGGGYASDPHYVTSVLGVCHTFAKHLPELNKLSDDKLNDYDVSRDEANDALSHLDDFKVKMSPVVRSAVNILGQYPIGPARRGARTRLFNVKTDEVADAKQNTTPAWLTAGALLLALI